MIGLKLCNVTRHLPKIKGLIPIYSSQTGNVGRMPTMASDSICHEVRFRPSKVGAVSKVWLCGCIWLLLNDA